MARICVLLHSPNVGAGTIPEWAVARGHDVDSRHVHLGDALPQPGEVDLVFSMGGPMGVYEADRHPWIDAERTLLARLVDEEVPLVGICLGAQLLASALGGDVAPHTAREVGWWPVDLAPRAREYPWLDHLPDSFEAFMWHGDRYTLPDGAVHIASSAHCDNHGFVTAGGTALGLQFHPEFAVDDIERLVAVSGPEQYEGPWAQPPADLEDAPRARAMRTWFWQLLDAFAASVGVPGQVAVGE